MIETELNKVIKSIKGIAPKHCDICGQKYEDTDFKPVKAQNQQSMIHLSCQNCGNSYMLNIVSPAQGLFASSRAAVNLDVNGTNELMQFAGAKAISSDDALDAYNLFYKSGILEDIFTVEKLKQEAESA